LDQPSVNFFPYTENVVNAAAEPNLQHGNRGLELVLTRATGPTAKLPAALDGVLVVKGAGGAEHALTLHAASVAPSTSTSIAEGSPTGGVEWRQALLFALLGGVVLNLMPC